MFSCCFPKKKHPLPPAPTTVPTVVGAIDTELINAEKGEDFLWHGVHQAKVVSIYDGDTIRVVLRWKEELIQLNCRLYGIDCPEMKTPEGKTAKQFLVNLIDQKIVTVEFHPIKEKFGRALITVKWHELNINQYMIQHKHAKPYFGGTKT